MREIDGLNFEYGWNTRGSGRENVKTTVRSNHFEPFRTKSRIDRFMCRATQSALVFLAPITQFKAAVITTIESRGHNSILFIYFFRGIIYSC